MEELGPKKLGPKTSGPKTSGLKKFGLVGVALVAFGGIAWVANAADQDIDVSATVEEFCTFTMPPQSISAGNFTQIGAVSTTNSAFEITNPVDASGSLNPASLIFIIPATCNSPATVTLTTLNGGLTDSTPVGIDPGSAAAFRNVINYNTTATFGTAFASLNTNGVAGASGSSTTTSATTGNIGFQLSINNTQTEIVTAGDYADTLTLSVTPQ